MNSRWKILGLAVAVLGLILMVSRRPHNQPQMISPSAPQPVAQNPVATALPPEIAQQPQLQPTPTPKVAKARVQKSAPTPSNNAAPGKDSLRDPTARDALALVGSDSDAEQYWLSAIFDPTLPDNERSDLMEDLNETGFSDPSNLTANDLPLILNRLQIIDAVLPEADDFMTEHLLEAQKDLAKMFAQATGQQ